MSKYYTEKELNKCSDEQLYILAYDYCPSLYNQLPKVSRKDIVATLSDYFNKRRSGDVTGKESMENWFTRSSPTVKVAIAAGIFAVIVAVISMAIWLISTPAPVNNFSYSITVRTKSSTMASIPGANVAIYVPNKAALRGVTDSDGLVIILVGSEYADQVGRLTVEADKYKRYDLNINLTPGELPAIVQLEPLQE